MSALPPTGPTARWLTTWRVLSDPFRWYPRWRAQHGDTFQLSAINGDVIATCDPEVIRDLFRADSTQVEPFGADAAGPLVGHGSLLLLKGEAHRRERKLLMPPFHGPRMRAYGDIIHRIADRRLAAIETGAPFRAADAMLDISLEVIIRAVYGVDEPERVQVWSDAIRTVVASFHPALIFAPALQRPWVPMWRRFAAARQWLDDLIHAEIGARRAAGGEGDDILGLMLQSTYDDGEPMPDEAVRDELVTLLFAGHETTQIAMAWALYRLARHPAALARLQDELDGCDGSPEALGRLPYLDAVVQETLRMQPIVPDLIRTLSVDMTLGPYELPAGTHVAPVAAMVHVRDDLYPEPHAFRPERFEEHKPRPWELLPFGGGVRRCVGASLATFEMKVVLGTWLRQAELRSIRDDVPVRRNIAMGAKRGVPMVLTRRRGLPARHGAAA